MLTSLVRVLPGVLLLLSGPGASTAANRISPHPDLISIESTELHSATESVPISAEPRLGGHSAPLADGNPVRLAQATAIAGSGVLRVRPSGASSCPGFGFFFAGQNVRITGGGFSSSASVEVFYESDIDARTMIATVSASSTGGLDEIVTLPAGLSTPATGAIEARGMTGGGLLILNGLFQVIAAGGSDGDSDLVPDACDNCPADPNAGQEDDDSDGLGDVCDIPCPSDPDNDVDGDGLCASSDPCPLDPDNDVDGDLICGDIDNCPADSNPSQLDLDGNGIGDVCQLNPTCSDGIDNDGDGLIDSPADPGCADASDTTETDPALPCDDGIDNDSDGLIDFVSGGLSDPGCASSVSPQEDPECDDSIDNDFDGKVDWDGKYGVHPPDDACGGDGSVTNEPEPGFLPGLAASLVLLIVLWRRRRTGR